MAVTQERRPQRIPLFPEERNARSYSLEKNARRGFTIGAVNEGHRIDLASLHEKLMQIVPNDQRKLVHVDLTGGEVSGIIIGEQLRQGKDSGPYNFVAVNEKTFNLSNDKFGRAARKLVFSHIRRVV
jgi:hypothetical protein